MSRQDKMSGQHSTVQFRIKRMITVQLYHRFSVASTSSVLRLAVAAEVGGE
jgi:hypothetical protein